MVDISNKLNYIINSNNVTPINAFIILMREEENIKNEYNELWTNADVSKSISDTSNK